MDDVTQMGEPNGAPAGPAVTSVQFNTGPRFDMPIAVLVEMLQGMAADSPQLFATHYLRATTGITGVVKSSGGRPKKEATG